MTHTLSSVPNNRRQILIVDDEPENLVFLEAILGMEGYQIRKAHNGREAVDSVNESLPDLVVMDVGMPIMDGFEACQIIKEGHREDFVPVILLTGFSDEASHVRGLDSGADEYLIKPPQREEFLARVRAMLRIRDLQHHLHVVNSELQRSNEELMAARKKIEEELRLVGEVQKNFLPSTFPQHLSLDFGCFYHPSSVAGAGGDYYDTIEIGHDHYGVVIADVTGHGAAAAVIMAITHTLMNHVINTFKHPSTALKVLNEKLNEHLSPTYYVTMFYGILNHKTFEMTFASAGHDPMYIYRAATGEVEELSTERGFPLKLVEIDEYDEKSIKINPGDQLVLYTDGLIEVRGHTLELYGTERLIESIKNYGKKSARELVKGLLDDVHQFAPPQSFHDDVSLLTIRRAPE